MEIISPNQLNKQNPALNWRQAKFIKLTHKFMIANFMSREKTITSSTFSTGYNDKVKWRLLIHPKGIVHQTKKFSSLYVLTTLSDGAEVKASYKIKILSSRGEVYLIMYSNGVINFIKGKRYGSKMAIDHKFLTDNKNNLLPNGMLTLLCELMIDVNSLRLADKCMEQSNISNFQLSKQFGNLFDRALFSDFTIEVEENEIKVHKAILAARSPVFEDIFKNENKLIRGDRITVTDINYETLKEMIHFIYTEKVSNKEKLTKDLLYAAHKYALPNLKFLCEKQVGNDLSIETVMEIFTFSDSLSANSLKSQAIEFINAHKREVLKTVGWKSIVPSPDYIRFITEIFYDPTQRQR